MSTMSTRKQALLKLVTSLVTEAIQSGAEPVLVGQSRGGKNIYALSCPSDGSYLTIGRGELKLYSAEEIAGFVTPAKAAPVEKVAAPAPVAPVASSEDALIERILARMEARFAPPAPAPAAPAKRVKRAKSSIVDAP